MSEETTIKTEQKVLTAGEFRQALNQGRRDFRGTTVEGDLNLSDATVEGNLYLSGTTVEGEVFCGGNVALGLQCFFCFGQKVHLDHHALEKFLAGLAGQTGQS